MGNHRTELELIGVSKTFSTENGATAAVQDIHLSIRAGEFVCLVGPSGCGKSTLLSLIAGFEKPDTGVIRAGGREVQGPGPDRVVLFQEMALFHWLTVEENISFGMEMLGLPLEERRRRLEQYLTMVHLQDFKRARIHELSGGMRQRVALVRALAMEPEILLMDEPFSALDSHTRERLQLELQEIWVKTRKTIVFVTHGLKEAVALGERVILLTTRPGRIQKELIVSLPRPRTVDDAPVLRLAKELRAEIANWVDPITRRSEAV